MEEKGTAENNSPLDYSREGILTSFSGTLKLSANQWVGSVYLEVILGHIADQYVDHSHA